MKIDYEVNMSKFKVAFYPNIDYQGHKCFEKECSNLIEALAVKNALADYTLFLHEKYLMPDHSNYAYILVKDEDGEWLEYEEPEEPTSNHQWDDDLERCLKCGDKDWYASPTCTPKKVEQEPPTVRHVNV